MKKIAVILAGCGSRDGSEINEAVCALLAISQSGCSYTCFAPDRNQIDLIDHTNGQTVNQQRNLLVEAARISRGQIECLSKLNPVDFDAIVIPGGFGIAKNFSDYPLVGNGFVVDSELKAIILQFHSLHKWIGAICIAPVLVAGAFAGSGFNPKITTGLANDSASDAVKAIGCQVVRLPSSEICIDETNRIVTAPAYMNEAALAEVFTGIQALVTHICQNC